MARLAVVLVVSLTLAAADLAWKAVEPTPMWAFHERSPAWLVLSLAILAAMMLVIRIPAKWIPVAAGFLAGGVLGNALSAAWNGLTVPNPIVIEGATSAVAFNLADIWALVGIVSLVAAIGVWLVQNRSALPTAADARNRWGGSRRRDR